MMRAGIDPGSHRRYADIALGVLLLAIIGLMIAPVPTPVLDLLLAANIALAAVMLLIAMTIPDGLAFAAMPTVLLVTTLFRLALNVSSTRLILLQADAGRVIEAFGAFVVRGNYVVGAVVFLILTLIQYIVVARGAERVAEVGARFMLDAMPGKQLAIDSDLRSGAITPDEARARRKTLERESQFYGAMDGAMKFVKGDAIAGIAITAINIVAGVGIGVGMRKLGLGESLRVYGLLTVGDGLVCQIPSLLIATSAGLVVTRVASADGDSSLGGDVSRQLFGEPRVLTMAASFLTLLAIIPGLPALPFGLCAGALFAASYGITRARKRRKTGNRLYEAEPDADDSVLALELGTGLERALAPERALEQAVRETRERLQRELGLPLPGIALRHGGALGAHAFVLSLHEAPIAQGEIDAGLSPAHAAERIGAALYTAARRHAGELFGLQQTQRCLDQLERSSPAVVRTLVPKPVSPALLCEVLRRLLAEGVSIRPLDRILEVLAAAGSGDAASLTERVRAQLARQISHAHAKQGVLAVHALDPLIEDALRDAAAAGAGATLALPPDQARDIVAAVQRIASAHGPDTVVLISQPDVRRHLRSLLQHELPEVPVLSYPELSPEIRVEPRSPVRIG